MSPISGTIPKPRYALFELVFLDLAACIAFTEHPECSIIVRGVIFSRQEVHDTAEDEQPEERPEESKSPSPTPSSAAPRMPLELQCDHMRAAHGLLDRFHEQMLE